MLEVSKEFEEVRNQRFMEKEKVYGGNDNPKNYQNMTKVQLLMRVIDQADIINRLGSSGGSRLKKELVDTANLCELAWMKLR